MRIAVINTFFDRGGAARVMGGIVAAACAAGHRCLVAAARGDAAVVEAMFRGIRPAVVALIAAPTFKLAKSANVTLNNCWIPIGCALAIYLMGISPILIILLAGICGYVYGQYIKPTE